MSAPKKVFLIGDPFDAKDLARMFKQLTGKQASPAEIDAAQTILDEAAADLTPFPGSDAPSSRGKQRQQRGPRPFATAPTRVAPAASKKHFH